MSLRSRIAVIFCIIFCAYAGFEYVAYHRFIYPVFVEQEQQQAHDVTESIVKTLKRELADLQYKIASKAHSGAFYTMLQNPSSPDNPVDGIDFMVLYDYKWNPIQKQLPAKMTLKSIDQALLYGKKPFLNKNQIGFSKNEFVNMGGQCAFVMAEPILSSPQSTAVDGMILAGHFLTDQWLQDFRDHHRLKFNWSFLLSDQQRSRNAETIHQTSTENPYCFNADNSRFLECTTPLWDNNDQPILLIKTSHDRQITTHGKLNINKLMLTKLSIAFIMILFLTGLLQLSIISPIRRLIKHVSKIGHPGSAIQQVPFTRNDEIGKLATEFNNMAQRLQNAQIKLMEKSYVSGATEMSSGILHNVRNALSPITTQIERIKDQFQEFPLNNLEQAQAELQTGSLSPQRREDLIRFVELTFEHVLTNLKGMITDLEELSTQVIQIEDMLNTQRTFGRKQELHVEYIEPIQLLNNALEIIPESVRDKNRINISHAIEKLPPIPVHPTTFIQILQNLLINSSESLERENPLCRKISISCKIEEHDSVDMLHWRIEDNGIGIEPDKIESIFERGASSKNKGLTGIGLHWCSNTINAMQGRLWAESKGEHCGACLHLLIPMSAEECLAGTKEG